MREQQSENANAQGRELLVHAGPERAIPVTESLPSSGQRATSPHPVLQMQRRYGNRYVQRMLGLSRQSDGSGAGEVTPDVESAIERARGGGLSLDSRTRGQMESAFGADFSGVRIHTGAESHSLNRSVNAVAFTTGRDIFFRDGAYNPDASGGRELLAHELTHVVQQGAAPQVSGQAQRVAVQRMCSECEKEKKNRVQAKLVVGEANDQYEQEADRAAKEVMSTRIANPAGVSDEFAVVDTPGFERTRSFVVVHPQNYAPDTYRGRQLLAHEITHVVQQTRLPSLRLQRATTLGKCKPVQDDLKPSAPWATLQAGYKTLCSKAVGDVAGQAGRSLDDILHGRMPRAPHPPDARSSVDCACAYGTAHQAALAAIPVLAVAGPLALSLYVHFLDASGAPVTIDVADMIKRSAGVRKKIRKSIGKRGMTGTTRLEQHDYGDRELQFAYGAIDCVRWTAVPPARHSWRSDPKTQVRVEMLDYYEFHPGRRGVSQCAHAACVQCAADGTAKNFWTSGVATVSWHDLQQP